MDGKRLDSSQQSLTLAIFQGQTAKLGQVDQNLEKMKEMMVQAKSRGADVIVFPELFTTGYTLNNALMSKLAEDKSGATFMELSQYAKDVGIAVVYGYPELVEKDESKVFYNSAQFIDKDGVSLANYQKTHLWIDYKKYEDMFTPGNNFDVFEFCGFKIGLLICFDVEFSESVRILATMGAKLILVPTAVCKDSDMHPIIDFLLPAHCYENCVHLAYVNYLADNYEGCSRVLDDKGEVLISLGNKEEGVFTTIVQKNVNSSIYLQRRRPELYNEVTREKLHQLT